MANATQGARAKATAKPRNARSTAPDPASKAAQTAPAPPDAAAQPAPAPLPAASLIDHADGRTRCWWPGVDPVYVAYHDDEWGVPEFDDRALFEKLILDGFQAGLSWITILRKRDNFRRAFADFEPERIAAFGEDDVARLMADAGIVRNRAKIEGTIAGARAYLDIQQRQGFARYLWDFVDGAPVQNTLRSRAEAPVDSDASKRMSKDLKGRGFKFCGPTITYAFMQAVGMVNDHLVDCFRHAECAACARPAGFSCTSP